jgi:bifunctional UDP-N-acetylglucosamine pyrophosphorylase/glucosamine-1-phosphate N-acetyltransferase
MTSALPHIGPLNWQEFAAAQVDPAQWTAIVPAAGRGTRLGFHRSKILYPVAGRPILDWLLDFLAPGTSSQIFVLSPEGAADVAGELQRRIPGRFEVALQPTPTGMGDAVALALPYVSTTHVAIVWGDQVALRRQSVEACLRLHQGPLQPHVTCPTVLRPNPYIHFERDAQGLLSGVRQAREGDSMPEEGESDTGFFCFRTSTLRQLLDGAGGDSGVIGRITGEVNLLPLIAWAARDNLVLTPRIMNVEETMGVNSKGDAAQVERFLHPAPGGPGRTGSDQVRGGTDVRDPV